jgi:hypothetical protein
MGIPYAFLKAMKGEEPYMIKSNRLPKEQAEFLMKKSNMKGKYLGACMDSCRWGSPTTVMYETNVKGMIDFIRTWMQQNEGNFKNLWHEKQIEESYTKFELPFIHHETCPRDKEHKGVVRDLGERLRCAHKSEQRLKPSFAESWNSFDELSGMEQRQFYENEPRDPTPEDIEDEETGEMLSVNNEEYEAYLQEADLFEHEEPIFLVNDACYAIISDKGRIMPLETIIKRLNLRPESETVYCDMSGPCKRVKELSKEEQEEHDLLGICRGHYQPHNKIEFPFDGWDLAFYAQKWYQQLPEGKALVFEK